MTPGKRLSTRLQDLHTSDQVYFAGRAALSELLRASTGKSYLPQDQLFALLAGPEQYTKEGQQLRSELAGKMRQVIDDQRLVSLDTVISLGDGLDQMAKGKEFADSLVPLAGELREFEMPKPLFTKNERTEFAAGLYSNRHTALQMRTDLIKIFKAPSSPAELIRRTVCSLRSSGTPWWASTTPITSRPAHK